MSDKLIGRAFLPESGMCSVEHVGGDQFRLIPDNNPYVRFIRHRNSIQWRGTRKAAAA